MLTKKDRSKVAINWLKPVKSMIVDLMAKSETMDHSAFMVELERAIKEMPEMMDVIDIDALALPLASEVAQAIDKGMTR